MFSSQLYDSNKRRVVNRGHYLFHASSDQIVTECSICCIIHFGELEVSKPGAKKGKQKKIRDESDSEEDEDSNDQDVISAIVRSSRGPSRIHFGRRSGIFFSEPI